MAPSEGADTCHEGSNDHIRRSISVATLILRQDERGGAAIEGAMVLFVTRHLTRESKRAEYVTFGQNQWKLSL